MKKYKSLIILLLCACLTGCASIPEPSEKVTTLVYGNVNFEFTNQTNANLLPESDVLQNGVEVAIQNRKTRKKYYMRTNQYGEFYHANVPAGPYRLCSVKKNITGNGNEYLFGGELKERGADNYNFQILDNYANNVGVITLKIEMNNVYQYTWYLSWAWDYKAAQETFWEKHWESDWLYKEWRNTDDYYQR